MLLLSIPAEAPRAAPRTALRRAVGGETMGTTWSLQAYGPASLTSSLLENEAAIVLDEANASMSTWEPRSEISRFNALSAGEEQTISPHFATVLSAALSLARKTGGAFDPACLGRTVSAGYGPPCLPGGGDVSWSRLRFDPARRRLGQPGGVRLDLSGIAKGWAADRLAGAARRLGASACLAEIGGEYAAFGLKPDLTPWWLELEGTGVRVGLAGDGLATSGHTARSREVAGRRTSHVAAPDDGLASVTVLARDCMTADGWATALLAAGRRGGMALADKQGIAAVFALGVGTLELSLSAQRLRS